MGIKIHTRVTPERTSSSDIRLCPSRRSSYRSVMCFLTLGTRRQEGEGGKKRKRQRKRKLIPYSNHPSVDSTLLTSVRLLAPQPAGLVTAVAEATQKKRIAVWPLVCVAMTLLLELLYWTGVKGLGCHLEATVADTVTQQPDQHQCCFGLKVGRMMGQMNRL